MIRIGLKENRILKDYIGSSYKDCLPMQWKSALVKIIQMKVACKVMLYFQVASQM